MRERETLQQLIDDGTVRHALHQGSPAGHAVAALRTLLHWLGFDHQLAWQIGAGGAGGAGGAYGATTVAAVAEFARRNGSSASGERVTAALARAILARYDSLEELKQLAEDVTKERVERYYLSGGGDRIRIASLQTLLNELGYGEELKWARFGADGSYGRYTRAAVRALAAREGLGGDGTVLTLALARRVVAKLGPLYGDDWHDLGHASAPAPGSLSVRSVVGRKNRQFLRGSGSACSPWALRNPRPSCNRKASSCAPWGSPGPRST